VQEGQAFSGTVATFLDPGGPEATANYAATIDWGDGSTIPGTVSLAPSLGANFFTVTSTHTYGEEGTPTINVTINHEATTPQAVTDAVTVLDPPLASPPALALNLTAAAGAPPIGLVALALDLGKFEPNPSDPGAGPHYTASINWGDAMSPIPVTPGTIVDETALDPHLLGVSGNHTFCTPGMYTITTTITHESAGSLLVLTKVTVIDSGISVLTQPDLVASDGFWPSAKGQALLLSFDGGPTSKRLANYLAATYPNLYGVGSPSNFTNKTNADVAAYYLSLVTNPPLLSGPDLDRDVLNTVLDVYATTKSLGGAQGGPAGFRVDDFGLGARDFNIGQVGLPFNVPPNTTLNICQLLMDANSSAVSGHPWGADNTAGGTFLRVLALKSFNNINEIGTVV
jgi:hypothetical protein